MQLFTAHLRVTSMCLHEAAHDFLEASTFVDLNYTKLVLTADVAEAEWRGEDPFKPWAKLRVDAGRFDQAKVILKLQRLHNKILVSRFVRR